MSAARVGLLMGLGLLLLSTSAKAYQTGNTIVVMVQSPAWTNHDLAPNQPIIRPPVNEETLAGGINDLWPKFVSYAPQTEYVETFVQPDLSLGVQYNYHFNFELGARNSSGRGTSTPDGWYQLQIAVIKQRRN